MVKKLNSEVEGAFLRNLGRVMQDARKSRGLSLRQASQIVGRHHDTIRRWEAGSLHPGIFDMCMWCAGMGQSLHDIITRARSAALLLAGGVDGEN